MKQLFPTELSQLSRIKKLFSKKSVAEKENHNHNWKQGFLWHPGMGCLNSRACLYCPDCGERMEISMTDEMHIEIIKIINVRSKLFKNG